MSEALMIGWTTCDNEDIAERLAHELVERGLAACVQVDPIRSFYKWRGKLEDHNECRLTIKFQQGKSKQIEGFFNANHPYDNPEWVVVASEHVGPRYLKWALGEG
ncbi:MAG: divalent-cation tolerance protein CutA [Verrucomicrobiota bacterium]